MFHILYCFVHDAYLYFVVTCAWCIPNNHYVTLRCSQSRSATCDDRNTAVPAHVSKRTMYKEGHEIPHRQENKTIQLCSGSKQPGLRQVSIRILNGTPPPLSALASPRFPPSETPVEGKEISWSIYLSAVLAMILIFIGSAGLRVEYWALAKAFVYSLSSCTALVMVLVPKLWGAHKNMGVNVHQLTAEATAMRYVYPDTIDALSQRPRGCATPLSCFFL